MPRSAGARFQFKAQRRRQSEVAELFEQLSVVSAILGGFAFTFVGALLGHPAESRSFPLAFGASLSAAMAFMVSALGSVLASFAVKNAYPIDIEPLHLKISLAFLLGILCFVIATGSCGWLKSPRIGYASSLIAVISAIGVVAVLLPFLG
jgi:tetrahydromethanopterin S-methyltransferase subunit C